MHTVSDQNFGLVQPDSEMLAKTKCAICRYNRYVYIYIHTLLGIQLVGRGKHLPRKSIRNPQQPTSTSS